MKIMPKEKKKERKDGKKNDKIQLKVAATSLKLEIRLHVHQVGKNTRSGT